MKQSERPSGVHYDENISAVSPEDVGNGLTVIFEPVVPGFHNFMPADLTKTSKRPNPGPPNPSSPEPLTSNLFSHDQRSKFQKSIELIPSDSDNKRTNVVTCEDSGRTRLQLTIPPPASQMSSYLSSFVFFFRVIAPQLTATAFLTRVLQRTSETIVCDR